MLVLDRRIEQSIHIGDSIEVVVLGIHGDRVKLGIAAPRDVPVMRDDAVDRAASRSTPTRVSND